MKTVKRRFAATAASLISVALAALTGAALPTTAAQAAGECGALAASYDPTNLPHYDHVIVIMEENSTYRQLQASADAPYVHGLEAACGSYSNMHAATHPSNPNYMAATSGVAGISNKMRADDNVFHQLQAAGLTWKVYEESMPANCSATRASAPLYKTGHNPAYWYNDLRKPLNTCAKNDVPFEGNFAADLAADRLPTYSWVAPNLCHQFYWKNVCPQAKADRVKTGDAWLAGVIPQITSTASYVNGKTLVIITWDEGKESGLTATNYVDCTDPAYYSGHPDCDIPTVVLSPYIVPGTVDSRDANLYGQLATIEKMYGLPLLGRATGQTDLRHGLGF